MKIKLNIDPSLIKAGLPKYFTQTLVVFGPDQMSAFPSKTF